MSEGEGRLDVKITDSKEADVVEDGNSQQYARPIQEPSTDNKEGQLTVDISGCKDTATIDDATTVGRDGGDETGDPEETATACAVEGQVDVEPKASRASTTTGEGVESSNPKDVTSGTGILSSNSTGSKELGLMQHETPKNAESLNNQNKEAESASPAAKDPCSGNEKSIEPASGQGLSKTFAVKSTPGEENHSPPDTNSNIKLSNKLLYSLD